MNYYLKPAIYIVSYNPHSNPKGKGLFLYFHIRKQIQWSRICSVH